MLVRQQSPRHRTRRHSRDAGCLLYSTLLYSKNKNQTYGKTKVVAAGWGTYLNVTLTT